MTQDNTGKLAEELRLLIDTAAERMQPWLQRVSEAGDGAHTPETCGWCPRRVPRAVPPPRGCARVATSRTRCWPN